MNLLEKELERNCANRTYTQVISTFNRSFLIFKTYWVRILTFETQHKKHFSVFKKHLALFEFKGRKHLKYKLYLLC